MHLNIASNAAGRDFVAGDIHGEFNALERALGAVGFDARTDRLLSVGDIIDRGPRCENALEWLESGRIHAAVCGNHEDMMLGALLRGVRSSSHAMWLDSGGQWWEARSRTASERARWHTAIGALPLAITLHTEHGPVGIVHASPCAGAWSKTVNRACDPNDVHAAELMMWGASASRAARVLGRDATRSAGDVRIVCTGHYANAEPYIEGRIARLDTGAGLGESWSALTIAHVNGRNFNAHSEPVAVEG